MFEVIIAIVVLSVLIFVHELGHFVAAKLVGVRVLDFSIGFGKAIYSVRIRETVFKIGVIPLGGYIRMLNESNSSEVLGLSDAALRNQSYSYKSAWQKIFILIMGPMANIAAALLLFFFLFLLVGTPKQLPVVGSVQPYSMASEAGVRSGDTILLVNNYRINYLSDINEQLVAVGNNTTTTIEYFSDGKLKSWLIDTREFNKGSDLVVQLGIEPTYTPVILRVIDESPAAVAGILAEDRIVSINSRVINSWMDVVDTVNERGSGNKIDMVVLRDGDYVEVHVELGVVYGEDNTTRPWLGVQATPNYLYIKYGITGAATKAVARLGVMAGNILGLVWGLVTGELSLSALGGPLSVIALTADSTAGGAFTTLTFLAYISINLAILNMLPIPLLDGGNIVGTVLSSVTRRYFPNSKIIKTSGSVILYTGLFFLLGLFAFVFINDIRNII